MKFKFGDCVKFKPRDRDDKFDFFKDKIGYVYDFSGQNTYGINTYEVRFSARDGFGYVILSFCSEHDLECY